MSKPNQNIADISHIYLLFLQFNCYLLKKTLSLMKIFSNMCCVLSSINFCTYFMFTLHKLSLFYGPGDAIAAAARLWLLSTLSCPASCMWPPEVSDAVHCSPL